MHLPHPSELTALQALLQIDGYEESNDTFACTMYSLDAQSEGQGFSLPALLLPMLIHHYGAPDELVGETFLVESLHERLTRKMVEVGWDASTGAVISPRNEVFVNWEQAIESYIGVASK